MRVEIKKQCQGIMEAELKQRLDDAGYEYLMERKLKQRVIDAEYEYLNYVKDIWTRRFIEETRDFVWDTQHWSYKLWFPDKKEIDIDVRKLYLKLSAIVHPDKCNEPWASSIFTIINDAYSNNQLNVLLEIYKYWEEKGTFDGFVSKPKELTKQEQIDLWYRSMWYQWFQPCSTLKYVLISPQVLKERVNNLQKENERLEIELAEIKRKISLFNLDSFIKK